jgi:hypothetical protein
VGINTQDVHEEFLSALRKTAKDDWGVEISDLSVENVRVSQYTSVTCQSPVSGLSISCDEVLCSAPGDSSFLLSVSLCLFSCSSVLLCPVSITSCVAHSRLTTLSPLSSPRQVTDLQLWYPVNAHVVCMQHPVIRVPL